MLLCAFEVRGFWCKIGFREDFCPGTVPVTRCAQPHESFRAQGGILTWSDTTGECGIPCLKESLLYEADVDVLR